MFFQVVLCSVNSLGTFGSRARASQSALARDSVKATFKQSPGSKNQAASVSKKKGLHPLFHEKNLTLDNQLSNDYQVPWINKMR